MCPVMCLLNASEKKKNSETFWTHSHVEIRTTRKVRDGEQLFITYGDGLSNGELLSRYGYIDSFNEIERASIDGEIILNWASTLEKQRERGEEEAEREKREVKEEKEERERKETEDQPVVQPDQYFHFYNHSPDKVPSDLHLIISNFLAAAGLPCSDCHVYSSLAVLVRLRLSQYTSSDAADQRTLSFLEDDLEEREDYIRWCSAAVRLREKKVLRNVLAAFLSLSEKASEESDERGKRKMVGV